MPIVEFPERAPRWVFERNGVEFAALVDGKSVPCLASAELLYERFEANSLNPDDVLQAFKDSRPQLEALARAQFTLGRADPGRELVLTPDTLALHEVTYSESVEQSGDFRFIKKATAFLSDIVGRSAPDVSVFWDQTEENKRTFYSLHLTGPHFETTTDFARESIHLPHQVYLKLARLWGDVLENASRRSLRELIESGQSER